MFASVLQCNLEKCMKVMSLPAEGCSCPLVGNSQEHLLMVSGDLLCYMICGVLARNVLTTRERIVIHVFGEKSAAELHYQINYWT